MSGAGSSLLWSEQQHSWLQALGYTLYLQGGALDAPEPVTDPAPAPAREARVSRAPSPPAPLPVRKAPVAAAAAPPTTPAPASRPSSALRLPDRLQIALLRASGCNPNDPQTRVLMESWPLAELRRDPAAKRALWPQLRALRRKSRE